MSKVLSRRVRRTRRLRWCVDCQRPIPTGITYAYYVVSCDGDFKYGDMCMRCDEAHEERKAKAQAGGAE